MNEDPLALLIAWLRAQPEITVPVSSDLFGHNQGEPLIVIDDSGGYEYVKPVMDRCDMVIHSYGPNKQACSDLARMVRGLLLKRLPAERVGDVVVSDVVERHRPFNDVDPLTGEQRYLHLVSLFLY